MPNRSGKKCASTCRACSASRQADTKQQHSSRSTGPGFASGLFFCAPGRAHVLGGESPLHTRQGEVLAERQGCRGRLRIRRKLKAKRWPDEQEADMRRRSGVSRQISVKPDTCTERCDVYPTGISVKVRAQYPGRSACVPWCY